MKQKKEVLMMKNKFKTMFAIIGVATIVLGALYVVFAMFISPQIILHDYLRDHSSDHYADDDDDDDFFEDDDLDFDGAETI